MSFNARMKEEEKSLASKNQVDATLDTADKNREKNTSNVWPELFKGRKYSSNDGLQN